MSIKKLFFDTDLNRMLVLLTNRRVLNLKLSGFDRLKTATAEQLNRYEPEGDSTAVSWPELDEDLSVKGFIKQAALEEALYTVARIV